MLIGVIIGSVVLSVIIIAAAFYFFGQKFLLQLAKANEAQRKGNKEEIESSVKDVIANHEKLLGEITKNLQKELRQSQQGVVDLKTQNAAIREQLANTAKVTEGLQVSTEGLRSLLANNRLRGEWGEQVAEDLLLAAGFVEKVNYLKQATTAEARPDFTILLPDGYKLNVDAKFPFDDLITYQEAKSPAEKKRALAAFNTAVKNKIREVSSKDYIDPENQKPQSMQVLTTRARGKVDRATVYRTIELFERRGIARRLNIGWKYKIELSDVFSGHHHHMYCTNCGRMYPLPENTMLETMIDTVAAKSGFSPRGHQLEVFGLCTNCAKT